MRGLCQVCHHSQRSVINEYLSAGRDLRSLADAYGLDTRALRTHRDEHVRMMCGMPTAPGKYVSNYVGNYVRWSWSAARRWHRMESRTIAGRI